MRQSFLPLGSPANGTRLVPRLRETLARQGLAGLLIPHEDEFLSEYLAPSAERLLFATGFSGSAGFAIVLQKEAAIFVDGRYTVQAKREVDPLLFSVESVSGTPPETWLATRIKGGDLIGYDPWLHQPDEIARLEQALALKEARLTPVSPNPIDALWTDRPAPPPGRAVPHAASYAGEAVEAKITRLAGQLASRNIDAAVVTRPDHVAWLLNIRGGDIPHTPVALSRAILDADGTVTLFLASDEVDGELRAHLGNRVTVRPLSAFPAALDELARGKGAVEIDATGTPVAVAGRIRGGSARVEAKPGICLLPRAAKNETERAGARAAHLRDGAAVTRFLAWLDREAPTGTLDEITAAETLEGFREATGALRDLSFPTISAAGPNAAMPHYRVTTETNRPIRPGEIYLVDSGGQYVDGTTDITRTIIVGDPTAEMRERFTRVLKGHIAIATARFPAGTTGGHLDALARSALWQAGLDFNHGTGHGVGSFLSVHEGPQSISSARRAFETPLIEGMILSNEPGYYKEGAYGIRIETLVLVTAAEPLEGGDKPMHRFETLTLAPFDRRLIDTALLTTAERAYVDAYHARVRAEIGPLVDPQTAEWLAAATAPL